MWRLERNKEESKSLEIIKNMDEQDKSLNSDGQIVSADGNSDCAPDNLSHQMNQGESQTEVYPILELQKFLNTEGSSGSPDNDMFMTKEEETKINQLTEELVQVFDPDNLDKASEA